MAHLIVQGYEAVPEGSFLQGLIVGGGPVQLPYAQLLQP